MASSSRSTSGEPKKAGRAGVAHTRLRDAWRYGRFALGARRLRDELDGARTYCLFIGHARSGHSIVGALLDAHPQIVISDELDALRYLEAGFSRRQLLYGSLEVSRRQAANLRRKGGRGGKTYSYYVPGQWQGRAHDLRVVGDSRAGWTTRRLAGDPALLSRLEERMAPLELRFIHVVRNPFDNIATMMLRSGRDFDSAFSQYAANVAALEPLSERIGRERLLRVRHEAIVAEPRERLKEACRFLRLEAPDDYLDAAASILYAVPSRSRREIDWPPDRAGRVAELVARHEFLGGYTLED